MMADKEIKTVCPASPEAWRAWLQENHAKEQSVWLIYYKKNANVPSLTWSEAVDEALCFGWIDSLQKSLDDERAMQFYSRRKAKSMWSGINKEKVRKLIEAGKMTQAGLDTVTIAQQNGYWTILDDVEALVIPADLEVVFQKIPESKTYFLELSKSNKRILLQSLLMAKRPETRQKRIKEIIALSIPKIPVTKPAKK